MLQKANKKSSIANINPEGFYAELYTWEDQKENGGIAESGDFAGSKKSRTFIPTKITKDELQSIISGKGKVSDGDTIQSALIYIRRKEGADSITGTRGTKSEIEKERLVDFIDKNNLWYLGELNPKESLGRGGEHIVYEDPKDKNFILKTNNLSNYSLWSDYFINLLLNNTFFPDTSYELIGFKKEEQGKILPVVRQYFVLDTTLSDLKDVQKYLFNRGFRKIHPFSNAYRHFDLGVMIGDLHNRNVLVKNDTLFFIDTKFFISHDVDYVYGEGGEMHGNGDFLDSEKIKEDYTNAIASSGNPIMQAVALPKYSDLPLRYANFLYNHFSDLTKLKKTSEGEYYVELDAVRYNRILMDLEKMGYGYVIGDSFTAKDKLFEFTHAVRMFQDRINNPDSKMEYGGIAQFDSGATTLVGHDLMKHINNSKDLTDKKNRLYEQAHIYGWNQDTLYKMFKNAFSAQVVKDYNSHHDYKITLDDHQKADLAHALTDEFTLWKIDNEIELENGGEIKMAEGGKIQNFTQFAIEKGYPSDYDTLFEAQLLGSRGLAGKVSKRSIGQQDERFHQMQIRNKQAHQEYREAILKGEIIDPEGKITAEKLSMEEYESKREPILKKIASIDNYIRTIEELGSMSHLPNGKLKLKYQRTIDIQNEDKKKLLAELETITMAKGGQIDVVEKLKQRIENETGLKVSVKKGALNSSLRGYVTFMPRKKGETYPNFDFDYARKLQAEMPGKEPYPNFFSVGHFTVYYGNEIYNEPIDSKLGKSETVEDAKKVMFPLYDRIDNFDADVKIGHTNIDWGPMKRGQGRRSGYMVQGSMSGAPRGIKSYPYVDWSMYPEVADDISHMKLFTSGEAERYVRARQFGANHIEAKVYAIIKKVMAEGGITYPIEEKGKWYGEEDYIIRGGKLVEMTPDEFLSKAKPLEIDKIARENIDNLKQHIKSNRKLDPLTLYSLDKSDVRNSDGRHRAIASKELGIKRIPVIDYTNNSKMAGGGIPSRYKNLGFNRVGQKKKSTRPEKKWMVLAKKGDKYKVVHGGQKGMEDFSQHHDKTRQKRFWNRMGGFDSAKASNPFSPLYWHKRFGTWEAGGVLDKGTIKVAWVDSDTPDIMESKMFDSVEDALKYSKDKKFLIFELEDAHDNYYKWSLLPYGMYDKYKMALDWADNLNLMDHGGIADAEKQAEAEQLAKKFLATLSEEQMTDLQQEVHRIIDSVIVEEEKKLFDLEASQEALSLEDKESLYKPFKKYGAKRMESKTYPFCLNVSSSITGIYAGTSCAKIVSSSNAIKSDFIFENDGIREYSNPFLSVKEVRSPPFLIALTIFC